MASTVEGLRFNSRRRNEVPIKEERVDVFRTKGKGGSSSTGADAV